MSDKEFKIDVENVIAGKSKDGRSKVPKFIVNYLKRIVHQDQINEYIHKYRDLTGVPFVNGILREMKIEYRVHGGEGIDRNGRYIFVSNHPLGGLDGMVLISFIGREFNKVKFVVNDLLMYISPMEELFIPINKYGKMKQDNARIINDAYSSDTQILNFPAGLCSRMIKGQITDTEWKKSFISKAIEYERDIVPIYFSGRNSGFFYRLAQLRKFLGIKFNIETLYLPDEMFKQNNSTFDLYIGEPVSYKELSAGHSAKEWTGIIRKQVYDLKP